jgi:hypothetical protein
MTKGTKPTSLSLERFTHTRNNRGFTKVLEKIHKKRHIASRSRKGYEKLIKAEGKPSSADWLEMARRESDDNDSDDDRADRRKAPERPEKAEKPQENPAKDGKSAGRERRREKPKNALERAAEVAAKVRAEREEREEKERQEKATADAEKAARAKERGQKRKNFSIRTSKGQPIMQHRMDSLLEKIKNGM